MDKSSIAKLRNYFSDRIEEIKEGSYIPTYEKIKELPEFSEVKRETLRIARQKWYSQHFGMSYLKYSKRLETIKERGISEKEYDKKYIKGKRNNGFCILIIGVIGIVFALYFGEYTSWYGGKWGMIMAPGIILLVIGLALVIRYYTKT